MVTQADTLTTRLRDLVQIRLYLVVDDYQVIEIDVGVIPINVRGNLSLVNSVVLASRD